MSDEKHYRDGDLDTHAAFLAAQPTPLIWKFITAMAERLRPQETAVAQDPEQARPGAPAIYKSVRLR
ncbi:MAG TPA: hypothetical protein VN363_10150 [Anaerolineales bacterium]|nr:hypothetical protein [Anaerolineales bacterium]